MRILLHIGPEQAALQGVQAQLQANRKLLAQHGVLFPKSPGARNHTRLFMAMTDPDHVDPLRFNRGHETAAQQDVLRAQVQDELAREVASSAPDLLILSATQLACSLHRVSELQRLHRFLSAFSSDIRLVAHIGDPSSLLLEHYQRQVFEGRGRPLSDDLSLLQDPNWWDAALNAAPQIAPAHGLFLETQTAPFWLAFDQLEAFWQGVFGPETLRFRSTGRDLAHEAQAAFDLPVALPPGMAARASPPPSASWIARARQFNAMLLRQLAQKPHRLSRRDWHGFHKLMVVDGPACDPGSLSRIARRFSPMLERLCDRHPGLQRTDLEPPEPLPDWVEPEPGQGFRASHYLLACQPAITAAARSEPPPAHLPPQVQQNLVKLRKSRFAPHNRLGAVNEEELAAPFPAARRHAPPAGSTGKVIVGCMKDEAPYILEWVAYHQAIGVDHFLIYSNNCSDGTSEMLDRLQALGVLQHRRNDNWKGRSPQQHALNQALKESLIRQAEWVIHIDVDEFINVRVGDGTLDAFLSKVPDATNVAMTWRLFGHNGVADIREEFVIDQFDHCAPRFCPKPHTVWGFKSMSRNTGAYAKLSCHRPNKLDQARRSEIRWVNGSGADMTDEVLDNGWRNSKRSIGYDLLQLNHYALRSIDSFLIKRQRGRALHVDRSIGYNYWIRMDWSDVRDITIKRNLPRLQLGFDALMRDDTLKRLHQDGIGWHRAKAAELCKIPEFARLREQASELTLNQTERVAYALSLDMES